MFGPKSHSHHFKRNSKKASKGLTHGKGSGITKSTNFAIPTLVPSLDCNTLVASLASKSRSLKKSKHDIHQSSHSKDENLKAQFVACLTNMPTNLIVAPKISNDVPHSAVTVAPSLFPSTDSARPSFLFTKSPSSKLSIVGKDEDNFQASKVSSPSYIGFKTPSTEGGNNIVLPSNSDNNKSVNSVTPTKMIFKTGTKVPSIMSKKKSKTMIPTISSKNVSVEENATEFACGLISSNKSPPLNEMIVYYSYIVETASNNTPHLPSLEASMVGAVADEVLSCSKKRMLPLELNRKSKQKIALSHHVKAGLRLIKKTTEELNVVIQSISSLPIDIISNTNSCTPKYVTTNTCTVIDGAMTVMKVGEKNESTVIASMVKDALRASFVTGAFLVGDIVDVDLMAPVSSVEKVTYDDKQGKNNDDKKTSQLVWAISGVVLVAFALVSASVTVHIIKKAKGNSFSTDLNSVKISSIERESNFNDDESTQFDTSLDLYEDLCEFSTVESLVVSDSGQPEE